MDITVTATTLLKEYPEFEENGFYVNSNGILTINPNNYYKLNFDILSNLFVKIKHFTGRIQIPGYDLEGEDISFNVTNFSITAYKLTIYSLTPVLEVAKGIPPIIFNNLKNIENLQFSQNTNAAVVGVLFGDCYLLAGIPKHVEVINCSFVNCTIPNIEKLNKNFIKGTAFCNCTDDSAVIKDVPDFTM